MLTIHSLVAHNEISGRGHLTRQESLGSALFKIGIKLEIHFQTEAWLSARKSQDSRHLAILDLDYSSQLKLRDLDVDQFVSFCFDWISPLVPAYNLVVLENPDHSYNARIEKFVGFKYLMIPPKLISIKSLETNVSKEFVFISLGMGASTSEYINALNFVRNFWTGKICIFSLRPLEIVINDLIEIHINSNSFYESMSTAHIVITNGGSTMVESIALGKRTISFPRNKIELFFAQRFLAEFPNSNLSIPGISPVHKSNGIATLDAYGSNRVAALIHDRAISA